MKKTFYAFLVGLLLLPLSALALDNGTYYLYNLGAKRYMGFGGSDGYTAAFLDYGSPLTITKISGDTYNIGQTHYDSGAYLNSSGTGKTTASLFTIVEEEAGSGIYTIKASKGFFGYSSSKESTLQSGTTVAVNLTDDGSDNVHWQLLTKAQLEARLADASPANPVDATFYIAAPGMNRHEYGLDTKWIVDKCVKASLYYNPNQAIWHTSPSSGETCSMKQTLSGLKPGHYRLTCQGFYRCGSNTVAYNAYTAGTYSYNGVIFADDQICPLLPMYVDGQSTSAIYDAGKATNSSWTWTNSTQKGGKYYPYYSDGNTYPSSSACVAFDNNLYLPREGFNTVEFDVYEGQSIEIGAMTFVGITYDWMAVDNFRLAYLGASAPIEGNENIDVTFNVENHNVKRFLDECGYKDNSTTSVVASYAGAYGRNDHPATFSIRMSDGKRFEIKNMIPGETRTFDVTDANGKRFAGKVTADPAGHVRMIDAGNVVNVRDLGGWTVADGRKIRYGRIYRGGQLNGKYTSATAADVQTLKDLGIGAEIDLRWKDGYDKDDMVAISAFGFTEGEDFYAARANDYTAANLSEAATQQRLKEEFQFILRNIKQNKAVYFHCAWGADRTGMLSFLLEGVLGQTMTNLYRNYELTSFSSAGARLFTSFQDRINVITALSGSTLRDKFENYFINKLGVSIEEIEEFRALMLTDNDAKMSIKADAHYATFIAPYNVTLPSGVKAYTVSTLVEGTENTLQLEEIEGNVLTANTPVIINAESEVSQPVSGNDISIRNSYTNGLLTGVMSPTVAPTDSYVLQQHGVTTGFYRVGNTITIPAGRCYLNAPASSSARSFIITEGDATAISTLQVLTSQHAEIFDTNGRRLPSLQKGINIVGGHKILVK